MNGGFRLKTNQPSGSKRTKSIRGNAAKPDSDRLARIGLFIGGVGGLIVSDARHTAENTGRLGVQIERPPTETKSAIGSGTSDANSPGRGN